MAASGVRTRDKDRIATDIDHHGLTLLGNLAALHAKDIANNLIKHKEIAKNLKLAKRYPTSLDIVVEIKDIHDQRIRGTIAQLVALTNDFNPREMKADEQDYGLVEQVRLCFADDTDFVKQLQDYFGPDSEDATKKRMTRYITAIDTFCENLIEAKISPDSTFEDLINLPIADEFRRALIPDPDHVVRSGHLFDYQTVVSKFLEIWAAKKERLGGKSSVKSDAFCVIVYGSLQARGQCCDIEVINKGVANVVTDQQTPDRLNFSAGIPEDVLRWGKEYLFVTSHGLTPSVWSIEKACLDSIEFLFASCQTKASALQKIIEKPSLSLTPTSCGLSA